MQTNSERLVFYRLKKMFWDDWPWYYWAVAAAGAAVLLVLLVLLFAWLFRAKPQPTIGTQQSFSSKSKVEMVPLSRQPSRQPSGLQVEWLGDGDSSAASSRGLSRRFSGPVPSYTPAPPPPSIPYPQSAAPPPPRPPQPPPVGTAFDSTRASYASSGRNSQFF